jgi:glycosyltransferase involved in cell wall biosynthesis
MPYPVIRFIKPMSQVWGLGTLRRSLLRAHDERSFDVVQSFSSYPTGFACLAARQRMGVPLVVTSQGGDLAKGSRFETRPLIMQRIAETLRTADAVTAISQYMRQRALAIEPGCEGHLVDIPNGVDCAEYATVVGGEAEVPSTGQRRFLLFMGRLHYRKAVDILIRAFQQVADRIDDVDLVIAGEGTEMVLLRDMADTAGLNPRVHFLGTVTGDRKLWLLQNALCLVAPTRTWEGLPVVVLEAMAAGLPILGTRVGGIVDLVEPGENGLLVDPQDAKQLADALVTMSSDDETRRRMAARSSEKAQSYDWQVVATRYLDLFAELIARHETARAA